MDQKTLTPELIRACRLDNRRAQSLIYGRYEARMLGVACRYIGDRGEAETVMVQSFYKAFTKLHQLEDADRFEPWLRRIVVHESLGYIRKNKKYDLTVDIEPYHNISDRKQGDDNLMQEELLDMIRSLPDGYRTVFNLFAIEGFTHQEISKQLSIPINTSKSKLFRARKTLQEMLEAKSHQIENYRSHGK